MNHLGWWVVKRHYCVVENIRNELARIQWRSSDVDYIISIFTNEQLIVGPRSNNILTWVQRYLNHGPTKSRPRSND